MEENYRRERLRAALDSIYGLKTQEEVGEALGVSPQRGHQIVHKLIRQASGFDLPVKWVNPRLVSGEMFRRESPPAWINPNTPESFYEQERFGPSC